MLALVSSFVRWLRLDGVRALRLSVALCCVLYFAPATYAQHSVTLQWLWNQGTGDAATGFHIQRGSATGGPYTVIATVASPTLLSYIDTSVTAGQTWFYVVTAFNSAGDSAPSNEVRCVIPFQAPAAPTGLSSTVK